MWQDSEKYLHAVMLTGAFCICAGCSTASQGVISRGIQGAESPVNIYVHFGGSAPLQVLHWLCSSELIGLASKVL